MAKTWAAIGPSDREIVYGLETGDGLALVRDGLVVTNSISGDEPDQMLTMHQYQALNLIHAQLSILPKELLPDLAADLQEIVEDLCAMHAVSQQGPQYERRVFLPGKLA